MEYACAPSLTDAQIEKKANELFADLEKENPVVGRNIERWLFIQLSLSLTPEEVENIRNAQDDAEAAKAADKAIQDRCFVTEDSKKYALHHCGISDVLPSLTLHKLYEMWNQELDNWNRDQQTDFEKLDWTVRTHPRDRASDPQQSCTGNT